MKRRLIAGLVAVALVGAAKTAEAFCLWGPDCDWCWWDNC